MTDPRVNIPINVNRIIFYEKNEIIFYIVL